MKNTWQFLIITKIRQLIKIINKWKLLEVLFLKHIKLGKWYNILNDISFMFEKMQHKICYSSLTNKVIYKLIKLVKFYFMKLLLRYFIINNSVFLVEFIKTIKITLFKNTKKKLIVLNLTRQTKIGLLFQILDNYINLKKIRNNINISIHFVKMLLFQFEFLINAFFEIMYFNIYSFQQNRTSLQAIGFLKTKKIDFCYYYKNL